MAADDRAVLGDAVVVDEDARRADVACARRSSRRRRRTGAAPSSPRRSRSSWSRRTCRPWTSRASRVPGRRYAYGPTLAPGPISACTACARSTVAPASTTVSISVVSGPTAAPGPTRVAPRSWVFGSITASRSTAAVTSIQVVAGSRMVTPERIRSALTRSRSRARSAGQLDPVVAAQRLLGVGRDVHRDRLAGRGEQAEHVGQVLLALVVVAGQLGQRGAQQARRRRRRCRR